jgi:hypothetical protein
MEDSEDKDNNRLTIKVVLVVAVSVSVRLVVVEYTTFEVTVEVSMPSSENNSTCLIVRRLLDRVALFVVPVDRVTVEVSRSPLVLYLCSWI